MRPRIILYCTIVLSTHTQYNHSGLLNTNTFDHKNNTFREDSIFKIYKEGDDVLTGVKHFHIG